MSYLYGDSTPSSLEVNFVDFLGDCLDFCAQLLASTESMRHESENGEALRRAAHSDTQRLERLAMVVSGAVKDVSSGQGDDHAARCAVAIVRSASDLVRTEVEQVNSTLQAELAKLDALAMSERQSCVKALETLLLRHDLPHTRRSVGLQIKGSGSYSARLRVSTPFGVEATLELDVPASHLFGHPLRLDRVVERLEVQAPDGGGWLHKEGRIRSQRLEKLYVSHLDIDAGESSIKLRSSADGTGQGFDVIVRPEAPRVSLVRVGDRDAAAEQPFEVGEADQASLISVLEKLELPVRELTTHRRALVQSTLDDRPLSDHEKPSVLAERLVSVMAPVTQEIARRSPSATELVLKRLVSGGRREEIFVTKAELVKRFDRLPIPLRAVFDPLGLEEGNGAHASPPASRSPSPAPVESPAPHAGPEPPTLVMARRSKSDAPRPANPGQSAVGVSSQVDVGASDNAVAPNGQHGADSPRGS
jgi:hypothetical protein